MVTGFFDPAVAPFAVALCLMALIAVTELVGALMGLAPSDLLDSMLPDIETDIDVDLDMEADFSADTAGSALDGDVVAAPDAPGAGPLSQVLGWLCVGRVPILVLLVAFLTVFGLSGFMLQASLASMLSFTLPAGLAALAALFVAIPATRWSGLTLAKIMPKEQTEAVSGNTFVGRIATITRGVAKTGLPAEAKLTDSHGHTHYILVEPDLEGESFPAGDAVLVVRRSSSRYRVIANPNPHLTDDESS